MRQIAAEQVAVWHTDCTIQIFRLIISFLEKGANIYPSRLSGVLP
jgi:hypothetical protein